MQSDYTGQEISSQVDAWIDAHHAVSSSGDRLRELWQHGSYDSVIFTGCGSTHYLAMTAASLFQAANGVMTRAVPASELLLHPEIVYGRGRPLLVAVSRSATTTETVQAVKLFKDERHGDVIVISCYGDKPLNALATINLTASAGQEVSVAQTRSFSSMLVMSEALAQVVSGAALPAQFPTEQHGMVENMRALAAEYADPERFERVFYLGSGALYGLACEAMLKMKEMSLTSAEAFHPLEFRHGPKSMVDDRTLVVALLDERTYEPEMAVIREMRGLGAAAVTLSPNEGADIRLSGTGRQSLVHYLPFLQWLAYLRAVNKGLNPDTPRNLSQVVIL